VVNWGIWGATFLSASFQGRRWSCHTFPLNAADHCRKAVRAVSLGSQTWFLLHWQPEVQPENVVRFQGLHKVEAQRRRTWGNNNNSLTNSLTCLLLKTPMAEGKGPFDRLRGKSTVAGCGAPKGNGRLS